MSRTAKRRAATAALAAAGFVLAGCGSSGPAPSHADRLACRTVWRVQKVYAAAHGAGAAFLAPGAAEQSVLETAQGASQPLHADMTKALGGLYQGSAAGLAAPERDCGKLGITAANAENMGTPG